MPRFRRADVLWALGVGVALIAVWPTLSAWWMSVLKAVAMPLAAGGEVAGPAGASVVLPLVLAALVALPLPVVERLRLGGIALGGSLGAELALVAVGATLHLGSGVMSVAGGLAQVAIPVAVLLVALRRAAAV